MNNIYKKIALLFFIIFIGAGSSAAQETGSVTGVVVDRDTKTPVEGATVTLFKSDDSTKIGGANTDATGTFTITGVLYGNYKLEVNMIGYGTAVVRGFVVSKDNPSANVNTVSLRAGITETEEILVETDKAPIEFKADKKVFNVEGQMITQGGSAADILKNIPSVSVDNDGNISLRGSTNVRITVDGKVFGLQGENRSTILQQIPANQVASIEVITNPGAKYDAEGISGIINIVMKKTDNLGYNGSIQANAGTQDKYTGSLNLNVRKSDVNVFGSYDFRRFNSPLTGDVTRYNYIDPSAYYLDQNSSGNTRNTNHFVKGGIDYSPDELNSISLSSNYMNREGRRNSNGTSLQLNTSGATTLEYFSNGGEDRKGYTIDANLNYIRKWKDSKRTLTGDFTFSRNDDDLTSFTVETPIVPVIPDPLDRLQTNDETNDNYVGQIDLVNPFSETMKLETGVKATVNDMDKNYVTNDFDYSTNQFAVNTGLTNRFKYKENVYAAYVAFSGSIKDFSYNLGLRGEQTDTKGDLVTTSQQFNQNYFDLFPSASLSQKLGTTEELAFTYSRRIQRPQSWALNPFRQATDPLNYFSGNPNLKPQYTNSFELSFIKYLNTTTITPSVFYRRTTDLIQRVRELLDSNIAGVTFANYAKEESYGAELIVSSQIFPFLNVNGSVSYFDTKSDAQNLSPGLVNQNSTWSGRATAMLNLPEYFNLMVSYYYSGKITFPQGYLDPFQSFDASISKDFFDKQLTLGLRFSDIFNTLNFKVNIVNDQNFREDLSFKRDSRTAFFNVTYRFGNYKDNKPRRRRPTEQQQPGNDGFGF
jgi:outer membrane receptor protein involved in Fe transport